MDYIKRLEKLEISKLAVTASLSCNLCKLAENRFFEAENAVYVCVNQSQTDRKKCQRVQRSLSYQTAF